MTQSLTDVIAEAMAHSRHAGGDFGMTGASAFRDRPNEFRREGALFLQAIDQAGYDIVKKGSYRRVRLVSAEEAKRRIDAMLSASQKEG